MSYQVALLNFEGPLDLLLQLIERSEVEITEISLASVTEQYLQHIGQLSNLDPLELNQFVELAAKLMYIKSLALLPSMESEEAEQEISELAEQLERYRHYQKATNYLNQLLRAPKRSWHREQKVSLPPDKLPDPTIDLETLNQFFQSAIARLPVNDETNLEAEVSIDQMIERIRSYVHQTVPASLSHLLRTAKTRMEALVLFLALLELIKEGTLAVEQHNQFDDIVMTNV
jgi:segregation and condensation protein A